MSTKRGETDDRIAIRQLLLAAFDDSSKRSTPDARATSRMPIVDNGRRLSPFSDDDTQRTAFERKKEGGKSEHVVSVERNPACRIPAASQPAAALPLSPSLLESVLLITNWTSSDSVIAAKWDQQSALVIISRPTTRDAKRIGNDQVERVITRMNMLVTVPS